MTIGLWFQEGQELSSLGTLTSDFLFVIIINVYFSTPYTYWFVKIICSNYFCYEDDSHSLLLQNCW